MITFRTTFARFAIVAVFAALVGIGAGCVHAPVVHPGQINAFDGTAYDTLVTAQAAIEDLRVKMAAGQFPQFKDQFNLAVATFNTAEAAYKTYHLAGTNNTAETQSALQLQIAATVGQVAKLLTATGVKL